MYELKKNWKDILRVNLLGPGPRLMEKKNLPARSLTKVDETLVYWTLKRKAVGTSRNVVVRFYLDAALHTTRAGFGVAKISKIRFIF